MNSKRSRQINNKSYKNGIVIYWMSREHRVNDNWALIFAYEKAIELNTNLHVVFCLRREFPHATERLVDFMLDGLKEVESNLRTLNSPFHFLLGDPQTEIPKFVQEKNGGMVVIDFHPLRPFRNWKESLENKLSIPLYEVDSRNIIPCWIASGKQEYGAYTFRPKFQRLQKEFLDEFPVMNKQMGAKLNLPINFELIRRSITIDGSVKKVDWVKPGEKSANALLKDFLKRIGEYGESRNDPTKHAQSHLSSHLHFGHLSAQRVVLEIIKQENSIKSEEAFLEEITVRRELADNYCYYNENYDSPKGFPEWAVKTLQAHKNDTREYLYSLDQLIACETHDDLWNAAMTQAKIQGIMHGYLRMYWAKKILEWSPNVEVAQKNAIYIMDEFFLDGRETNGFTGIAWSMGGVHDRAWFERAVFGKVRYMSYNGAKSKFDVQKYIRMIGSAQKSG